MTRELARIASSCGSGPLELHNLTTARGITAEIVIGIEST